MTTKPDKEEIIDFTLEVAQESIQKKALRYDRGEDEHYDTISAFIKSMRGSDPDATLYWLAKMIYAGEDPRFIARRIVICASEDVGNADPRALVLTQAAFRAIEFIGLPEAKIPLAQAAVYVATAPKSNACYLGIEKALKDV
ncbi:MAG TPA: replication-associated recombination protein A, partial [bacterium]|nr:replication-associated recombination protein A [bacterium]